MGNHTFAHRASFIAEVAKQYLDQYLCAGQQLS
jgi:hypothetical protein